MFMGDSITAQASPNNYYEYLFYQLLLQNYDVQAVGSSNGFVIHGVTTYFEGHPGFQTYQLEVERYIPTAFPAAPPDTILLYIGVNDLFQLGTAGTPNAGTITAQRLRHLMQRIYSVQPAVKVFVAQISPVRVGGAWAAVIGSELETYNSLIPSVVRPYGERAAVLDFFTGYDAVNWFTDDVHPDFRGAQSNARAARRQGFPD